MARRADRLWVVEIKLDGGWHPCVDSQHSAPLYGPSRIRSVAAYRRAKLISQTHFTSRTSRLRAYVPEGRR